MCGICVIVSDTGRTSPDAVRAMCDRIVHRGPDSDGYHTTDRVGLGMRRLSIIDLAGGSQPIYNEDRTIAVVFNGEIYNYRELRSDLQARGHRFSSAADTEVIVHLYEEHGPDAVTKLRGMFAIAIHDLRSDRVFLARDRLGIKPLHYAALEGDLFAASEIKSLTALPGLPLTLDEVALDQYFSLLYVPAPRTMFQEVRKLPPGHYLIKDPGAAPIVRRYWRLTSRPGAARSEAEWIDEFHDRFQDAVESHLVADVPIGVFLSGGVDSSGIVAAMARAGGSIKTFSLGFPDTYRDFDERRYAQIVAERFGTDHEEIVVEPKIEDDIETLATIFDEPLGDSGAIPNLLVSRMARRRLKVALSGLGGDELAGGYERHVGVILGEWYRKLPGFLRERVIRATLDKIPESSRGVRGLDRAKRFVRSSQPDAVDRFFDFSSPMDAARRQQLYSAELREQVDLDSARRLMHRLAADQPHADAINRILSIDLQTYMVDDLLTVTDRVSMSVSLEMRVPFLDHPFVEFMAGVPEQLKIRRLKKKHLLKKAFARDVPREVLQRPKGGFSLPIGRWLREDLRCTVEDVLSPARMQREGLFQPSMVETLKREHFERKRNWSSALWALLMFHLWKDRYLDHG